MSCDKSHIGTRLDITIDGVVEVGIELSLVVIFFSQHTDLKIPCLLE